MEKEPISKPFQNAEKKPKEITHYIYIKGTGEIRTAQGEGSLKYKLKQIKDEGLEVEKVEEREERPKEMKNSIKKQD